MLTANPEATAASLAESEYSVVYADDVVHDVALRFVHDGLEHAPVLELQEPAHLWPGRVGREDEQPARDPGPQKDRPGVI